MLYFNTHVGATLIAKTVSVSRTSLHGTVRGKLQGLSSPPTTGN